MNKRKNLMDLKWVEQDSKAVKCAVLIKEGNDQCAVLINGGDDRV